MFYETESYHLNAHGLMDYAALEARSKVRILSSRVCVCLLERRAVILFLLPLVWF